MSQLSAFKARQAAYLATVCLIAIQVAIGVVMKLSQSSSGGYEFSPTSSVTISESFKFLLSLCFFAIECHRRARRGVEPKGRTDGGDYALLSTTTEDGQFQIGDDDEYELPAKGTAGGTPIKLTPGLYVRYIWGEITTRTKFDVCNLALFYLLVNNTIFACYKMADPGTISLMKSAGTAVTALIAVVAVGTRMTPLRWAAIVIQVCGIAITQYKPEVGAAAYPLTTYLLLAFHLFLSAGAGVYNQAILKRESASLHVSNIFLYATGSLFNLITHFVVRLMVPGEPGFFDGYDKISAILVIVSNVFVGLAITAVLKYADAIIKCLASGIATGILLYLSSILFAIEISLLAIPGTVVVFTASYLYIVDPTPPRDPNDKHQGTAVFSIVSRATERFPRVVLLFFMGISFATVTFLWAPGILQPPKPPTPAEAGLYRPPKAATFDPSIVESPLKDTLAFVRWNHPIPERVPTIMKYAPFFHTMHISMKESLEESFDFVNMTHDQWNDTGNPQHVVAKTMELILETEPEITGLLYFHFDAWIDPMGWADVNLQKILIPMHGGPQFRCNVEYRTDQWQSSKTYMRQLLKLGVEYSTAMQPPVILGDSGVISAPRGYAGEMKAGCRGWADIYYVPRRFFPDYIHLTNHAFPDIFHEVAVATILHLTNTTRSPEGGEPVIENLGCWGNCCAKKPSAEAIDKYICGHKFDHRKEGEVGPIFDRVEKDALNLGTPIGKASDE